MDTPNSFLNAEYLQHLVQRFHKAGWLAPGDRIPPDLSQMNFTLLGRGRMRQLFEFLQTANPKNSPAQSPLTMTDTDIVVMERLLQAMTELYPPPLSEGEKETLLRLASTYAKR